MKPLRVLIHLNRREPIVYFGCTWTEIKACIWRSAAISLPLTGGLMAVSSIPVLMFVPGLFVWLVLTRMFLNHINRHRAGKPLYYERHKKALWHPAFIRAGLVYQFSRNPAKSARSVRPASRP